MTYAEPENMTGIISLFRYADNVSGSIFSPGILIGLWIIVFAFLKQHGGRNTSNCAVAASFVTAFPTLFLFLLEQIGNWHFLVAILVMALSLIWSYFDKD